MAEITAQMVKELRDKTAAGMADCKKALVEAEGDMQKAIEILRKKGAASAAKRADRNAKEGVVVAMATDDKKKGIIIELNCETDFVAKNDDFVQYANEVAKAYLNNDVNDVEALFKVKVGDNTVEAMHNDILSKFSEKIEVRRMKKINAPGFVSVYNHFDKKLGVLVEANIATPDDKTKTAVHDTALQIAAMNPVTIDRGSVTQEQVNKELEIYKELAINEGKTPEMAEKVAQGKLNKFYQESVLLEQIFAKDNTKKVNEVLAEANPELKVVSFTRYALGEEI